MLSSMIRKSLSAKAPLTACWGQWERWCSENLNEMQYCSKEVPGLWESAGGSREHEDGGGNTKKTQRLNRFKQGKHTRNTAGTNPQRKAKKCALYDSAKKYKWLLEHPLENAGMLHLSAFLRIWWLWQFWCFFRHQKSRKFPHLSQVQMKKESSLLQLLLKDPMLDFMIWVWLQFIKCLFSH